MAANSSFAIQSSLIATSGQGKVQLIELYSSESCSSCPPADQWVTELKNEPELWKSFVPVVFHVDYWNNLGWKDDYSSEPMTKRQIDISKHWAEPSVYTPGFIVDGKEWKNWRQTKKHQLPAAETSQKITLSVFRDAADNYIVKATGLQYLQKYIIRLAWLGMDLKTKITSGENSGKMLEHNFVVLNWDFRIIDSKKAEALFQIKKSEVKSTPKAIAAWIELDANPTPLQATGGYLLNPATVKK